MLDLLHSLEWCVEAHCPACGMSQYGIGHTSDCRLDRAIRELAEADPDGARLREMAAALGWAVMTVAPNAPYRKEDLRFLAQDGNFRTAADVRRAYAERASEPTVDEMARRTSGFWIEPDGVWDASGTFYREHKAKQGRLVIDPASPMLNEPPTDPSALAAWLYARVVPGRTIIEHKRGGGQKKAVIAEAALYEDDLLFVAGERGLSLTADPLMIVRLLNPDGTVLWEAK